MSTYCRTVYQCILVTVSVILLPASSVASVVLYNHWLSATENDTSEAIEVRLTYPDSRVSVKIKSHSMYTAGDMSVSVQLDVRQPDKDTIRFDWSESLLIWNGDTDTLLFHVGECNGKIDTSGQIEWDKRKTKIWIGAELGSFRRNLGRAREMELVLGGFTYRSEKRQLPRIFIRLNLRGDTE